MEKPNHLIPTITLIGDPEENFYQLGLKDRENYSVLSDHLKSLISTPWSPINNTLEALAKLGLKQALQSQTQYRTHIEAYSEGLDRPFDEVSLNLLLPEVFSIMSKWIPGISPTLLGCSSYFVWNKKNASPLHGRILDFPLKGSYEKNERAIHYKFSGHPEIFTYSTVGLPYPSLTSMTSEGVTFALHQKFSEVFDPKGTPIFELIFQLLSNVHDKKSTLEFLKKSRSLTTWAFNMSFSNGDVLSIDIMGDQLIYEEYKLEKEKALYFNNQLIDQKIDQEDYLPYGLSYYNSMRENLALKKIKKLRRKESPTQLDLLKTIGTPHKQKLKNTQDWKLDPLTPSTVALATFNAKEGSSFYIPGDSPKFYRKEFIQFEQIWEQKKDLLHKQKLKKSTMTKAQETYMQGMSSLMQAQTSHDQKDIHLAYHHIQMAIDHLDGYPEGHIAQFYFNVFQYIHETAPQVRANTLNAFLDLEATLPPYLKDHCLLFIARLNRLIIGSENIQADTFQSYKLRDIYQKEKKIPNFLLHKVTSYLMNPRIDLLDIIYPHIRS